MKKLFSLLAAAVVVAVLSVSVPKPAHAAANWYFYNICGQPYGCVWGQWMLFGPFESLEQCQQAAYLIGVGPFGMPAYSQTGCFQQ